MKVEMVCCYASGVVQTTDTTAKKKTHRMCKWEKMELMCDENNSTFALHQTKVQDTIFKNMSSSWQVEG
jgi:hypothetical protein